LISFLKIKYSGFDIINAHIIDTVCQIFLKKYSPQSLILTSIPPIKARQYIFITGFSPSSLIICSAFTDAIISPEPSPSNSTPPKMAVPSEITVMSFGTLSQFLP